MIFEAPSSYLKKDVCEEVNDEMPLVRLDMKKLKEDCEGDDNDGLPPGWEAAGVKDGGFELCNQSVAISGVECKIEGETLMDGPLDVSSVSHEEEKGAASSDITLMEHIVEEVSVKQKLLCDGTGLEAANAAAKDEGNTVAAVLSEHAASENDDRPPPGWGATVINDEGKSVPSASVERAPLEIKMEEVQPPTIGKLEAPGAENDGDDGAPLGWGATTINNEGEHVPLSPVDSIALEIKMDNVQRVKDEASAPDLKNDNDDEDGPPPGWEPMVNNNKVDSMPPVFVESTPLEVKMEEVQCTKDELATLDLKNDDEGPPAGWEATVYNDAVEPMPPVSVESSTLEIEMEEVQAKKDDLAAPFLKNDDSDVTPPGWEPVTTKDGGMKEVTVKLEKGKENEEHPPPRPPLPFKTPSSTSEIGQMVCGSCRNLLSFAKGAKYVRCSCCQTVSFVLEAHEVGQVYCGGCSVLLMYHFGSSAVKCSGCKFITQITPHNKRPPLSEQGVTLQSQLAQLQPPPNNKSC